MPSMTTEAGGWSYEQGSASPETDDSPTAYHRGAANALHTARHGERATVSRGLRMGRRARHSQQTDAGPGPLSCDTDRAHGGLRGTAPQRVHERHPPTTVSAIPR